MRVKIHCDIYGKLFSACTAHNISLSLGSQPPDISTCRAQVFFPMSTLMVSDECFRLKSKHVAQCSCNCRLSPSPLTSAVHKAAITKLFSKPKYRNVTSQKKNNKNSGNFPTQRLQKKHVFHRSY